MPPLPGGRETSPGVGAPVYTRHRPECTLLYQLVQEYYPAFKAHLAAQGTVLPGYVEQEFGAYLKCGRLEHGFLWVRCDACHADIWSPSAAKSAAFVRAVGRCAWPRAPRCWCDEVFPEQPVRQWVLSVPYLTFHTGPQEPI